MSEENIGFVKSARRFPHVRTSFADIFNHPHAQNRPNYPDKNNLNYTSLTPLSNAIAHPPRLTVAPVRSYKKIFL